jgi:hypothetical protein
MNERTVRDVDEFDVSIGCLGSRPMLKETM